MRGPRRGDGSDKARYRNSCIQSPPPSGHGYKLQFVAYKGLARHRRNPFNIFPVLPSLFTVALP